MIETEEPNNVSIICPYCKITFPKTIDYKSEHRLFTILIKDHPSSKECTPFIAFVDNTGRHRGSQKIDSMDEINNINSQLLQTAKDSINELENNIRFYHIKLQTKAGRSFDHKVASVKDRAFMSSISYSKIIHFLKDNDDDNTFGLITNERDGDFEEGILVYGKYLGMIYTLFWKDQKSLRNKSLDEIKHIQTLWLKNY